MTQKQNVSMMKIAAFSGACAMMINIPIVPCNGFTIHSPPFVTRGLFTTTTKTTTITRTIMERQPLHTCQRHDRFSSSSLRMIYAPPGSGYFQREDEQDYLPESYDPMMEYPGTMRPGRTPENQAFHDLPIADDDPDPVPWPHFQEIEWHHNWGAPHEHPIPMEEFIELEGRWASVEDEAAMRAGVRRGVRERRELEEMEKAATLIMDDDEDDEEEGDGAGGGVRLDIGDGVDALIGANALAAGGAVVNSGSTSSVADSKKKSSEDDDEDDEDEDDFLLDLGLDFNDGDDDEDDEDSSGETDSADDDDDDDDDDSGDEPAFATSRDSSSTQGLLEAMQSMIDMEEDDDEGADGGDEDDNDDDDIDLDLDLGLTDNDEEDDDDDIEFSLDDDDMGGFGGGGGIEEVPLDDLSQEEDMGDDDSFDDGGFDYE